MKQSRPAPVSLNRPMRVFGFDPQGLMGCTIGLAIGLIFMIQNLQIGLSIVAVSLMGLGGVYLYGNHRVAVITRSSAAFQKARYEPTKRDVFKLEVK
jgi:hypothetical protein